MNKSKRGVSPSMTKRASLLGKSSFGREKKGNKQSILENKELLIGIGVTCLLVLLFLGACYYNKDPECSGDTFETFKSGFENLKGKVIGTIGGSGGLKELDVIYFYSKTCPWCKKMTKVLEDAGEMSSLTVVDVTTPDGQKAAKEMGAVDKGIPAFISKANKTGTVGFKPSVAELVKSLNKKGGGGGEPSKPKAPQMDPNEAVSKVQDLQMVLFASPSCGYCSKMKDELSQVGVLEMVEVIDVSTPEGQASAKEMLGEIKGVPVTMSRKTGKSTVGYKPLGDIVVNLS